MHLNSWVQFRFPTRRSSVCKRLGRLSSKTGDTSLRTFDTRSFTVDSSRFPPLAWAVQDAGVWAEMHETEGGTGARAWTMLSTDPLQCSLWYASGVFLHRIEPLYATQQRLRSSQGILSCCPLPPSQGVSDPSVEMLPSRACKARDAPAPRLCVHVQPIKWSSSGLGSRAKSTGQGLGGLLRSRMAELSNTELLTAIIYPRSTIVLVAKFAYEVLELFYKTPVRRADS
ncbi:hypothetical protein C8R45DRAFT_575236 [Mycena sanguinolenta]|nr:hypothetical protein C8R45DRAFT_575236 [Mycena sanguinolenta]